MTGLVLETSAACQLNCPLCFLRSYSERPSPEVMGIEVVEAVVPFVRELTSIDLTGWGEPLMNPELFAIIETIRKNFSGRLTMTTNGLLLDRTAMEKIIKQQLDTICVSVDAATEQMYRATRPGGDFTGLRRVLEEFATVKEMKKAEKPALFATFLLRNDALDEIPEFIGMVAAHGLDGAVFQQLTGVFSDRGRGEVTHSAYYGNRFDEDRLSEALAEARSAAPPEFIIAGPEKILPERVGSCGGFDISRPFITASGLVSVCCAMAYPCALVRRDGTLERTPSVVFGDVTQTPLPEIWQDPAYTQTRAQIRSGNIPDACGDCIALYMKS